MKIIVNKYRKNAEKLGLTELPKVVLYARPRKIRQTASKIVPRCNRVIKEYIKQLDPSLIEGRSRSTYYCIAPQINLYVEIYDKVFTMIYNPGEHCLKVSIFSDNSGYIREVAKILNQQWEDGILAHMDWPKIEKVYNVNREDCITIWNEILKPKQNYCPECGTKIQQESKFCTNCGKILF